MNNEERRVVGWVYLIARQELKRTQTSIENMQNYWRYLQKKQMDDLGLEMVMDELYHFEKNLKELLKRVNNRIEEDELLLLSEVKEENVPADDMKERIRQLKYQIHENKQAGIFAWELAKELIEAEEAVIDKIDRHWKKRSSCSENNEKSHY